MTTTSSLAISGYQDLAVPNSFTRQQRETSHLGIVLPGLRYSVDRPVLHFAGEELLSRGADLLRVEYVYYQTDFQIRPQGEQTRWLSTDVRAACEAGLAQRTYRQITLVGKSLGTLAMGHVLENAPFRDSRCIWLTPLLTVEWLRARIKQTQPLSLFVLGTADRFYDPAYLAEAEKATQGKSVVIEGADHSLEIPGSIAQSLDALGRIVGAIDTFLS